MTRLPPGPRGRIRHTISFLRNPYELFARMQRTYGDPYTLSTFAGPLVVTGDPALVREIFTADPDTFEVWQPEVVAPFLGETSLLLVSGARHKRDRKLLTPPFHGARMRAYGQTMANAAVRHLATRRPGETFSMQDVTQAISLEVILRAVFGIGDFARVEVFRETVVRLIDRASPVLVFFPMLRRELFGFGPWAAYRRASAAFDTLLQQEIDARQNDAAEREDILSMMMCARYDDGGRMSHKDIRDQLWTLLLAGHETTATALAWAMYWVHRDSAILRRILDEIDGLGETATPEAIAALPYLDAVCSETLRLYPIVPDIPRRVVTPMRLGDYEIPARAGVNAATTLVHTREDLYPEPQRFRPERFLERKFSPFEYLPFGGGSRRCLGAAFATYELKIVLATMLQRYVFALASDREVKPVRRTITMGPASGVPITLVRARVRDPGRIEAPSASMAS